MIIYCPILYYRYFPTIIQLRVCITIRNMPTCGPSYLSNCYITILMLFVQFFYYNIDTRFLQILILSIFMNKNFSPLYASQARRIVSPYLQYFDPPLHYFISLTFQAQPRYYSTAFYFLPAFLTNFISYK